MLTKKWKDEAIAKAMVELGDWMLKELKLQVRAGGHSVTATTPLLEEHHMSQC